MKYIFLDTFALAQLTKDYYARLSRYLAENGYYIIISAFQLIEYYSPMIEQGDRTNRAVELLATHPFVIVNQDDIFHAEEDAYPGILTQLPYQLTSDEVMGHLSKEEKEIVLFQMLHEGIPDGGFNLKEWTAKHNQSKMDWPEHVAAIIQHADEKYLLKSKAKFLQSHDLRFCEKILDAIEKLGDPSKHDTQVKRSITKLSDMRERKDTWRMRGIHLASLIFWYDYIIAKKKIKPSDEGDLFHSMIFPYCSVVVTDNSRVDGLETIQRNEKRYTDVKFFRISDFIAVLRS